MLRIENCSQSQSSLQKKPFKFDKAPASKNRGKRNAPSQFSQIKQNSKALESYLTHTLSKNNHQILSKESRQELKTPCDKAYSLAKHHISLIEDPLWKNICDEMLRIMGPTAGLKIWLSSLGSLSSQDRSSEVYCQTEELAQLLQQYDFIVLGCLQRYFPALKELRIRSVRPS